MREEIPIGLLFSESGPYALIGQDAADGARAAVRAVNEDPAFPFRFAATALDPRGETARYAPMAEALFGPSGCRHVIGTITSSSRKEVLAVAERHRGLLWYAFPYEGYESSENVVYLGATANQQVLPLLDVALERFGPSAMLVAPDYVWGWEINRIARDRIEAAGGRVVEEICLPVDTAATDAAAARIRAARPDFVLSSLIGPAGHAFARAKAAVAGDASPLVSCNMTEADAVAIGPAVEGTYVASIHFAGGKSLSDAGLRAVAARRPGRARAVTSCFASAFAAVLLLAEAIRTGEDDAPEAVKRALISRRWETVIGPIAFDPLTTHAIHAPLIGRARADGSFEIVQRFPPIPPDPYLVHQVAMDEATGIRRAGRAIH